MKHHRRRPCRRRLIAAIASGAFLLQGCPVGLQSFLADQSRQTLSNTIFFLLDAVVVRVT